MKKTAFLVTILLLAMITLSACSSGKEDKVALNSEKYIRFESIMNGEELTADDIDAISRTMLEDGTTTLDFIENAGYTAEQTTSGTDLISCFLIEHENNPDSFLAPAHDYELKFNVGKECYSVKGKIIVESERKAVRTLYRDLVSKFRWEYTVYAPMDSLRFICFGDDGNPEPSNAYYYDQKQYVSVLTELFELE